MNIHKFDNIPEKPFHSSGYAEVANGGSIGSTSPQSFSQRYAADRSRTSIRKYRDSHVGRGSLRHQARRGQIDAYAHVDPAAPPSRQALNATDQVGKPIVRSATPPSPRTSFNEPPSRGFNPYS